jgi:hypothetical protein
MAAMMFDRIIGDVRRAASTEMRLIVIAGAAGLAAVATLSLLCAAAFVFVMDRYGVLDACLSVGCICLIVTLALLALYAAIRRRAEQASIAARATRRSLLADPFVVATGVQVVQALGIKRAAALLAVAGTAMALASTSASRGRPEHPAKP